MNDCSSKLLMAGKSGTAERPPPGTTARPRPSDHFAERGGTRFAGLHIVIDLWGASGLDDAGMVERALRRAVVAAGATLLDLRLHRLEPTGGVSGMALLAESHISIHTWPEHGYAAMDVFTCGESRPHDAASVLCEAFSPETIVMSEHRRGALDGASEEKR